AAETTQSTATTRLLAAGTWRLKAGKTRTTFMAHSRDRARRGVRGLLSGHHRRCPRRWWRIIARGYSGLDYFAASSTICAMKSLPTLLRFPDFSFPLDVRLGVRMLGRYPGLTLVATIAIAIAIALGTLYFEALNKWRNPRLPVPNADRIVSIRNWDVAAATPEGRMLQDFSVWSRQLKTIDHVGAGVDFQRHLATHDGR